MKPVIEIPRQDVILTSDITEEHIVVAVINKIPSILSKWYKEPCSELRFYIVNNRFTTGNYIRGGGDKIRDKVEWAIRNDHPIAVFHQDNWKQALQWLIDNA
jgi:hypothetical protein